MKLSRDIIFKKDELEKGEEKVKLRMEEEFSKGNNEKFSYWLEILHLLAKDPYVFWDPYEQFFHIKSPSHISSGFSTEDQISKIRLN